MDYLEEIELNKCCRFCAKRMLKWYPKLLNDIYLSEVNPILDKSSLLLSSSGVLW